MKPPPKEVRLSPEQAEVYISELHQSTLDPSIATAIEKIIRSYMWLIWSLQETKLSLKRFRQMVFGAPAKASRKPCVQRDTTADERPESSLSSSGPTAAVPRPRRRGGHLPGQGRLGADAYTGAERLACRHDELAVGELCPLCGRGRLYALPSGVEIRVDGRALLSAVRYELEKLRCSACGEVFTASLPKEAGAGKYSARAGAVLAVSRYYLGLPFYRIERYQSMLGVPVPDATQWDLVERVGDSAHRVFTYLEELAAQGELIYQDDTPVRVLSLIEENQQIQAHAEQMGLSRAAERTGMYSTALVVKVGEQVIYLYYSGRSHAGENLQALLNKRQAGLDKPLVMSDALTINEADEGSLVRCHCMAHGRRKFSELEDVFPQECQVVLDTLKQVFDHDEEARKEQMDALGRLSYHQQYSRPLMDALKGWLKRQFDERLVEPNSSLGKAIAYMQGHWETLTRFLEVAGAPLDNNLAERSLKLFIRQRKNSLFFATEHSAYLGSLLTSVIATCVHAGVSAVDYLEALQENRHEVFANPAAWLPWTYRGSRSPPQLSLRQSCAMRA